MCIFFCICASLILPKICILLDTRTSLPLFISHLIATFQFPPAWSRICFHSNSNKTTQTCTILITRLKSERLSFFSCRWIKMSSRCTSYCRAMMAHPEIRHSTTRSRLRHALCPCGFPTVLIFQCSSCSDVWVVSFSIQIETVQKLKAVSAPYPNTSRGSFSHS